MANESKPTQKRGRKKGSSDSINVKIQDLIDVLPLGAETAIPVRRKWIEQMEGCGIQIRPKETPPLEIQEASDKEGVARERLIVEEDTDL